MDVRDAGSNSGEPHTLGVRIAVLASRVRGDFLLVLLDVALISVAYLLVVLARFDFDPPALYRDRTAAYLPVAVLVQILATWLWGGYGRTWQHASVDEARRLLLAGATAGSLLLVLSAVGPLPAMPISVLLTAPVVATLLQGLARFQERLFAFRRGATTADGLRVAVVGGGATGAAAVREMQRSPQLGLRPVVVVDDDPYLQGRVLLGVPVAGPVGELGDIVRRYRVHSVFLAAPSGGAGFARRVADAVDGTGVALRVLPQSHDWVNGEPSVRDARELRIEDLLGRAEVTLDPAPVRELLRGRRVLVTGAGGSIGSEIARQVAAAEPHTLVLLDHDETHLHDAVADLRGRVEPVLADVRDPVLVQAVFERHRPDIVFHAAAHKHVPILERFACEAIRTNVLGTLHVVEAAARVGVPNLVCISTDKAADPSSAMGASKWLAEQVVLDRAPAGGRYSNVRFGNVLGSRGSVIPTFQRQIAEGGPVTVTDPRMTRWFMSIDEAVRLVLQAAAVDTSDRVLALRMGEQLNIYDLAERMIRLCGREPGRDVDIVVTGTRPGEKLTEELVGAGEELGVADGPILAIHPRRLSPGELAAALSTLGDLADAMDDDAARRGLLAAAAPWVTGVPEPGVAPGGGPGSGPSLG